MPYKVFVAGEEALAADANTYLMSQTVPRFTNAAQRTSQLTAPVLNQLSMLDSTPGVVDYWTGSAWAPVPAGMVVDKADANAGAAFTPGAQFVLGADFNLPGARNYLVFVSLVITLNVVGFVDLSIQVSGAPEPQTYPISFPSGGAFMTLHGEWLVQGPVTPGRTWFSPSQAGTVNRGRVLVVDAGPKVTIT